MIKHPIHLKKITSIEDIFLYTALRGVNLDLYHQGVLGYAVGDMTLFLNRYAHKTPFAFAQEEYIHTWIKGENARLQEDRFLNKERFFVGRKDSGTR